MALEALGALVKLNVPYGALGASGALGVSGALGALDAIGASGTILQSWQETIVALRFFLTVIIYSSPNPQDPKSLIRESQI